MFRKQFNVRKNTNLRGSDTRKLVTRLSDEVGPDAAGFDKKSQVAQVKIVNMHGDGMNLYLVDKTPMFFDFSESGVVYPSVFFLWKHPISYPTLLVHEPVLQYLENGADLMLPGVVRTEQFPIPEIRKGGPVAIALYSQGQITGPVAVGCSLLSSQEMIASRFQGKGVQVLHVFRDALWEFGPRGQPPVAKLDELLRCAQEQAVPTNEDFPALGELSVNEQTPEPTPSHSQSGSEIAKGSEAEVGDCEEDDTSETETSESLLMRCFLAGLKFRLKKLPQPLPVDVGQFYVQCVLACVPGDRRLDMKKTKYKKFAAFLDEMVESSAEKGTEPIICLNKKVKGSERLSDVNWDHPLLKAFKATDEKLVDEDPNENDANKIVPPTISEYFLVTDPVLPLLKTQVNSVEKGELLTTQKLRGLIIDYVNANGLKLKKDVRVDPQIAQIAKIKKDIVDWNTLFQSVQARMTPTWKIQWADGRTIVRKVTMPKIEFRVESRAGNKKVTLVNNLSLFGVDIKMFCQQVHTKVATSVTVNATAILCEGPQVFIQGNQVYFVGDLLMNTYGIDKKFIGGLELAPKRKH